MTISEFAHLLFVMRMVFSLNVCHVTWPFPSMFVSTVIQRLNHEYSSCHLAFTIIWPRLRRYIESLLPSISSSHILRNAFPPLHRFLVIASARYLSSLHDYQFCLRQNIPTYNTSDTCLNPFSPLFPSIPTLARITPRPSKSHKWQTGPTTQPTAGLRVPTMAYSVGVPFNSKTPMAGPPHLTVSSQLPPVSAGTKSPTS